MSSIEEIRAKLKPVQSEARVCLNGELFREEGRLKDELESIGEWEPDSLSDVDPRTELNARLVEVQKQIRAEEVTFVFQSIGDRASSDLLAAHPSPKDDKGENKYAFDPQAYPVALTSAASLDPVMSVEDVEFIFDRLNLNGRNKLFNAAFRANNRSVDVPFLSASSDVEAEPAKKSR